MTDDDNRGRVRVVMYRLVDLWIEALEDLEVAEASGDPDAMTAADEALYEAAIAVAEPVLGNMLRSRMWREVEPLSPDRDDETGQRCALLMIRQFLIDTSPLSVPQVAKLVIDAADRKLGW